MSFSKLSAVALMAFCHLGAIAQTGMDDGTVVPSVPANSAFQWLEQSQRMLDSASKMETPEWLKREPTEEAYQAAEKIKKRSEVIRESATKGESIDESIKRWREAAKQQKPKEVKANIPKEDENGLPYDLARAFIFISQSMSKAELKRAMIESHDTGAVLVMRGIKPGQAIDHVQRLMLDELKNDRSIKPNAIISPHLFTQYNVEVVPTTVVHLNGKVAMARGTLSVDYLLSAIMDNQEGDHGLLGNTFEIAEPDMIEEMKRRTALIDWDEQKKGAADRYWTHGGWPDMRLPVAAKDRIFLVDPSFTLKNDIIGHEGAIVAKAGTTYNPQKILPMTTTLVIVDGTDQRQINAAKKYINDEKLWEKRFKIILTELDRKRGFESMKEIKEQFGERVYLLDKMVRDRFQIKAVPSIVYGKGNYYAVQEIGMEEKR